MKFSVALLGWLFTLALLSTSAGHAQEPPRIALANPLGAASGETTKVTLRGWRLADAQQVRAGDQAVAVKVLNKGNANVPNRQDAQQIGDTQVELELTVAEGFAGDVELVVETPAGESPPYAVTIDPPALRVAEKEPNNGFAEAQVIEVGQTVDGQIQHERDVDVYAVDAEAGRPLVVEVLSARRGTACDGQLTVYDAAGRIVAQVDDTPESNDPLVRFTPAAAGRYYLALLDAHDRGGPAHPYRLSVRAE